MVIREEALPLAAPVFVLAAVLGVGGMVVAALLIAIAGLCVCAFFRDPERTPPGDESLLVSPADGVVCQVIKGEARSKVAVFMSVLNVHVNRAPFDGRVEAMQYNPGKFLAAWNDKASLDNEQLRYTIWTRRGSLEVVQIAGLIARRIVPFVGTGTVVERGERIGLIRFGSRVELVVPKGVEVLVEVGEKVKAGLTPVARWEAQR
jgi:phosphatidylserine decarboxylase